MNLLGKVAVVTGGSRGIGRAIALMMAKQGAKVVINYTQSDDLAKKVKSEIEELGQEAMIYKADVSDEESVKAFVNAVKDTYGQVDVLVNNAGITKDALLMRMKEEDFIDKLFVASSHDTILCFTNAGQVYWKKVYELPQAGRAARGKPIVNLIQIQPGDKVHAVVPVREFSADSYLAFATNLGVVKRTPLQDFSRPRQAGIRAIKLIEGEHLVAVRETDGNSDIIFASSSGLAIRFHETDVRSMGRTAGGVKGINLGKGDQVISLIIANTEADAGKAVLTATENGQGKRTLLENYPCKSRATKGVISIQTSERNGEVVSAELVEDSDQAMLITSGGTLIRTRIDEISVLGRNTQGVKLIGLGKKEKLVSLAKVCETESEDEGEESVEAEEKEKE